MKLQNILRCLAAALLAVAVQPAFALPDLTFDPQPLDLGTVMGGTWGAGTIQVTNNLPGDTWVIGGFLNLWQGNYQVLPGTDASALRFLDWGDVVVEVGTSPWVFRLAPGESTRLGIRVGAGPGHYDLAPEIGYVSSPGLGTQHMFGPEITWTVVDPTALSPPSVPAAPEPASLALLSIGALTLIRRRSS
jgi:hypothetical protein